MMTVTSLNASASRSSAANTYATEASSIGLAPGEWPRQIPTELGNRQPFLFEKADITPDRELLGCRYTQSEGILRLIVFND